MSCVESFSPANSNDGFSLSAYQRARALETSNVLDASRFHFQICFVDNDNFHGRIAEGMLGRIAEYNDAMCVIFPASATIASSPKAPRDAAAPDEVKGIDINAMRWIGLRQSSGTEHREYHHLITTAIWRDEYESFQYLMSFDTIDIYSMKRDYPATYM